MPELVKERVTRQLPPVWKSSAILETLRWYSTSHVWEWETQNRSYRYYWELLTNETCPQFNLTQSTAGIWTAAQISGVLKSTDVFCPKTCLFLCAFRFYILMPLTDLFIIFLSWSQAVFVDFVFYYYFVVGRTSEMKLLEKCMRFWWLLNTTSQLLLIMAV